MEVISSFYLFLEILGTVAFAISGTVVGINHKLDVFGVLVMSVITAVGGGIFRDLLLGATPPSALKSPFFYYNFYNCFYNSHVCCLDCKI